MWAMSRHRLTRQEIKHDEFVSGVARVALWLEDHPRRVLAGAAVIVAGLLLGLGGHAVWRARQEKALAAFADVDRRYHAPVKGEQDAVFQRPTPGVSYATPEEKFTAVIEAADSVLKRFGSGPAARQTLYYKALSLRALGRYDEATAAFKDLLGRRVPPLPRALAQVALAETYEMAGRWEEAASAYKSLFDAASAPFPRELALLGEARCLEHQQKVDEARALYRKVVEGYPGSPYVAEAEDRLRQTG